ncbi:MAG: MoxR family ATPase [Lachnospiraceae bacterium]|nr:MoxR family ATPase [Lachnospiraceae bacterium]
MNIEQARQMGKELIDNIGRVIVGKEEVITLLLGAFLADGHVLLEDVPGVGKTKLAKSLAMTFDGKFARIQFTPDLLPGDVTGMNVYNRKSGEFELHRGSVFTNVLLADEINRATPRTQSGLLECMEERQVTIDGESLKLDAPFFVIATQNPVENAGTFPLPEAQLDRFMMKLSLGLPDREQELLIMERFMREDPIETLKPVMNPEQFLQMRELIRQVYVHPELERYVVELVAATREKKQVILGVSPRGTLALLRAARAYAVLMGRTYCIPDDIKRMAVPVLAHRLKLSYGHQADRDAEGLINEILSETAVPAENFSQ